MIHSDDQPQPFNNSVGLDSQSEANADYRAFFNSIDQGYCLLQIMLDEQGQPVDLRHMAANQAYLHQTGLHDVVGKRMLEVMPNVEPQWLAFYSQVALTGQANRIEYQVKAVGRWFTCFAARMGGEGSLLVAIVFDDITLRKLHEQRQTFLATISAELVRLRTVSETMESVSELIGAYFGVKWCVFSELIEGNERSVVSYGWNTPGVVSLKGTYRMRDFLTDEQLASHNAGHVSVVDNSQTDFRVSAQTYGALNIHSFIMVPIARQGQWRFLLSVIDDKPRHWQADEVGFMSELTEYIWNRLERARAEEALREADQRKDEFLAMLAHELRNPMATLHNTLLLLDLTQGADASLPLDRALAMMSREVGHLNRMVNDLLDVSRIGQGKVQLRRERIDFHKLVEDTLEAARAEFIGRGQLVTRSLSSGPTWVAGDDTRLTQVVRNLLSNAAKYTPNGGQIEVMLASEQGQAVLTVRDSGIGLAADQLEAIFEVFFQVSTSLDRPQGGLGLGLAVVKQLVELQGGSVGVESPGVGKGSTFIVKLPLLAPLDPTDHKTGAGATSSPGRRILVVDDHADLALTTMMLLKQRHYEAHYCLSGAKALEAVERLNPDAVLLDLGMPGMDGYETARRLRETPWGRYGVIVALSGYGQEEDKRRTQAGGFDGHLAKPINLALLTQVLEELLNSTPGS